MTTRLLTKIARRVYKALEIADPVQVRVLGKGQAWFKLVFGLHTRRKDGSRIMWLHLRSKEGKPYSRRFVFSVLAHELAHVVSSYHGKAFRYTQRAISRMIRERKLYA